MYNVSENQVKEFLTIIQREYIKSLLILYPDAFEENREAFFFSDMDKIDAYVVKYDNAILGDGIYLYLYQGNGNVVIDTFENELLKKYRDLIFKTTILEEYIKDKYNLKLDFIMKLATQANT